MEAMFRNRTNLVLIGFMGSGKSCVGVRLSYRMRRCVLDTDKMIEKQEGKKITEIFAQMGEEYFREQETALLRASINTQHYKIFSVGGGMPVREENRQLLRRLGTVIYLRAKPETIYERLKGDTARPLLMGEDPQEKIRRLMEERAGAYESCADVIVDVDDRPVDSILDEIQEKTARRPYGQRREGVQNAQPVRFSESEPKKAVKDERAAESVRIPQDFGQELVLEPEDGRRRLLVINGPNLNFLGIRNRSVYGVQDYQYLLDLIAGKARQTGCEIRVFQSNYEGAIIDRLQQAYFDKTQGVVINPGAFTHYSYAIRDALESVFVPKVEVHISDITQREDFRKVSVTAPVCDRQIYGQGLDGYLQAIDFLLEKLNG